MPSTAASLVGVVLFLALVAPFLAVVMWAGLHGVTVTVGGAVLQPVPLLEFLDGGLGLLLQALLFLMGLTVASELGGSVLNRAINGTASAVAMYVLGATVVMLGSALLFNVGVDVLAGAAGARGGVSVGPVIHYPDPVSGLLQVGLYALPFTAAGALLNAILALSGRTNRPRDVVLPFFECLNRAEQFVRLSELSLPLIVRVDTAVVDSLQNE